jgi:NAD(P)-dependent dehydrogenase (short-subunit alcohol dehydrogenase family)
VSDFPASPSGEHPAGQYPAGGVAARDFPAAGAALVVGASGGIGAAAARLLAARGSTVALTYRSTPVDALAAGLGARTWRLDVVDPAAAAAVVDEVADAHGGLHTLVYAAGPPVPQRHLSRVGAAQLAEHLAQEALGFFHVLSPALAHLRATRGSVVAVTTAATDRWAVRDGLSAVPKGAVEALVRGVAAEEGRYGVRANCVGPGMLTDGMALRLAASGDLDERALAAATANIPLRTFGTAQDIAEAVCFLASTRARYITAQKLNVDGGYAT